MTRAIILVSFILLAGCSPPLLRGDFTLLSTEDLSGKYVVISNNELTGKACFSMVKASVFVGDGVFDAAVRDALVGQPDGTVLVDAEFVDKGSCISVTGLPARLN